MKRTLLLLILLLVVSTGVAMAQARQVTGQVLDETGQGLPGAGINVRGTNVGTVTDVDGNFTISLPADNNVLVVQAVSYQRQEVTVTGNTVTVRMASSATQLKQTVVTALAVKREKRELGYSASTLSNEELTSGNNISALSAIQGKTSGVNITSTTGGPGGSTRVVLRGEKSITGNNNALIVVDGIPINNSGRLRTPDDSREQVDFGNSGNDINPDDIESISVLKGPSAAALYGSRAANGAIIITTKSGRNKKGPGKMEVQFKTSYTLSDVLRIPKTQHQFGEGNIYQGIAADRRENFSWGLPFDGQLRPWGQIIDGQQKVKPYSDQPNNIRDFFNTGKTWDNYLSLAGGTDRSTYFMSLNAVNNTGVIPNTFYNKYNIRFNGSTQLSNKFYSSINFDYININSRVESGGQAEGSVMDALVQTPRDIPMQELRNLNDPFSGYGIADAAGVQHYGYYGAYTQNPFWVAQNYDNRNKTDRVLGGFTLGVKPNEHWDIYDRFGGDVVSDRSYYKSPKYNLVPFDDFWADNPKISQGGYEEATSNLTSMYNDFIISYKKSLSQNIGLDVLVGNNTQLSAINSNDALIDPKTNGLVIPDYYNLQNAQGDVQTTNALTRTRQFGVYGDFRVDYRKRIFFDLTARNDWTSTLITGNNSYFYPSANLSWVFTEGLKGKFFENILTYGKIRGGYASVGNGAGAYLNNNAGYIKTNAQTNFGSVIFPFSGQPGYTYQDFIGNNNLLPERTNNAEIGTDLSFFRDRVNIEFTYFNSHSVDQIIGSLPTAPSSGYTAQVLNIGEIQNKGIELSLRLTPIQTHTGFRWDLFGTYTKTNNKVLSLSEGVSQVVLGGFGGMNISAAVGKPYDAIYSVDFMKDPDGHVIIDPSSGLPQRTADLVYQGSALPKFIASWGTTLTYRGFSLNVLFVTKQGGKYWSRTKDLMDFVGTAPETAQNGRDPYIFPNSVYQDANGNYVTNTQYKFSPYEYYTNVTQNIYSVHVLDASYVKLQEASLYYTLPAKSLHRSPFGTVSLGVYGNNLFLWTAKENVYDDPEQNAGGASNEQGFQYSARPSLRNYGLTLKLTF